MIYEVLVVFVWLMIGSALRYVLPYVIKGLVEVGLERPWPKWEWRYLSAFALAVIGFGLPMLITPGFYTQLAGMPPIGLIGTAYAGNELAREVVKAIEQLRAKE